MPMNRLYIAVFAHTNEEKSLAFGRASLISSDFQIRPLEIVVHILGQAMFAESLELLLRVYANGAKKEQFSEQENQNAFHGIFFIHCPIEYASPVAANRLPKPNLPESIEWRSLPCGL